ncbi:MAG TPA: chain-length determining protein [Chromatiaceae bacterium]|jgi:polysaccharide chain length determinant protein (PEP-CTERM system associated)|nr:MAG: chain-length determining protein [Thiohalocapsa sp. PB-PSB1]HBG95299.1 chain-length determining protein [Chromatiaceae bacterium]HCS92366.1 chain-length determining protein [Chromatiaceae bacterium]
MQEIIRFALFYLSGIWRYRWYALIIAAVASPIGWAYVASLPDEYQSSARVYVDTDSVLTPLLRGLAIQTNDAQRVRMMTSVMFGRENMEKLARMTDMDLRASTPEQMDGLISELKQKVKLRRTGNNIYSIVFSDRSPELAKRVVQSMLTIFVESNIGSSRQDQDSAERFLQREIKDYERRLIEAERKLKDFQMRNLDLLSEKGSYYDRLKESRDALISAQDELALAESRREEVLQQLEYLESQGAALPSFQTWLEESSKEATSPQDLKILETQQQIDDLLIRYTERHPEIIALRKALARLVAQRDQQKAEYVAEQSNNEVAVARSLSESPIYQEMQLRLADAETEYATQITRTETLRDKIEKFQAAVDEVLQVEAEQKQLNRDYSILKNNHQSLITRFERARLTREVDTSVDTVKFRTLDPPQVPQKPSGPNRIGLSTSVFGGSLVAGLAIAFLMAQLRPVFFDRRQLTEVTGIPVLGSINMIWVSRQRMRKRLSNLAFTAVLLVFLGAYSMIIAVFFFDIDLPSKLPF